MGSNYKLNQSDHLKNQIIIKGFLQNDSSVILKAFKGVYPMIANMVTSNSGLEEDAREVMNECFEVFYKLCVKPDFELKAKFSSFMYSIAYRIWMKKLRKRQRDPLHQATLSSNSQDDENHHKATLENTLQADNVEEGVFAREMSQIVRNLLGQLTDECRTIFQLKHQEGKTHEEISELLGISLATSRSRMYRCSIKLATAIKRNPYYLQLIDTYSFLKKYIQKKRRS